MRKIINGKRYDTQKANEVASYEPPGIAQSDLMWFRETLYQTKKGNWFLHGIGEAGSPYNEPAGSNSWCGSQDIKPMTSDEAGTWLEMHNFVDELEDYFRDDIEDA